MARRIKTHVGGVTQTSRPYATVPRSHKSPLEEGALISGRKLPISMATNHGRSMGECLTSARNTYVRTTKHRYTFSAGTQDTAAQCTIVHYIVQHCIIHVDQPVHAQ